MLCALREGWCLEKLPLQVDFVRHVQLQDHHVQRHDHHVQLLDHLFQLRDRLVLHRDLHVRLLDHLVQRRDHHAHDQQPDDDTLFACRL